MNRRSYGYLVRALNELASVVAQCGSKDLHHPVPAQVPIRMDGLSRESRRGSDRITRQAIENYQLCHFRKK
jgi:hypothetical protein